MNMNYDLNHEILQGFNPLLCLVAEYHIFCKSLIYIGNICGYSYVISRQ